MMHAQARRVFPAVALAAAALVGCSKNPPCATDPSQIEGARAEAQAAAQQTESARSQLSAVEAQKADLTQKLGSLPQKDELAAKLEELKKGSGR